MRPLFVFLKLNRLAQPEDALLEVDALTSASLRFNWVGDFYITVAVSA